MIGIPGIQFPTCADGHVIAPMHHRPTGHTRTDIQPLEVGWPITADAFSQLRTGPDETHLAADHVPNCGNSSRLVRRSILPKRVTRRSVSEL